MSRYRNVIPKAKISRDIAQNGYCSREIYLQCSQNHRSSVTQVAVIRQILRVPSSAENIALLNWQGASLNNK